MCVKKNFKHSSRYKNVYVEPDIPSYYRKITSNLHTIINTLGKEKLHIKGSRVCVSEYAESNDGNDRRSSNHTNARNGYDKYKEDIYYREKRDYRQDREYNHRHRDGDRIAQETSYSQRINRSYDEGYNGRRKYEERRHYSDDRQRYLDPTKRNDKYRY